MSPIILRLIVKLSFISLLIFIPVWLYIIPASYSWYIALAFWWFPLLPPVWGILKNNYYTMSWASFLVLIPLCHGIMIWLTVPEESQWGMVELLLTSFYYLSFFMLIKTMKKQAAVSTQ